MFLLLLLLLSKKASLSVHSFSCYLCQGMDFQKDFEAIFSKLKPNLN